MKFAGIGNQEFDKFIITVDKVEIHARGSDWIKISKATFYFDLSQGGVIDHFIEYPFFNGDIHAGKYTKIRLKITESTIAYSNNAFGDDINLIITENKVYGYKFDLNSLYISENPYDITMVKNHLNLILRSRLFSSSLDLPKRKT